MGRIKARTTAEQTCVALQDEMDLNQKSQQSVPGRQIEHLWFRARACLAADGDDDGAPASDDKTSTAERHSRPVKQPQRQVCSLSQAHPIDVTQSMYLDCDRDDRGRFVCT